MPIKIFILGMLAFFTLMSVSKSSAATFITDDTAAWTTTDTNTSSSSTSSTLTESMSIQGSQSMSSQTYQSTRHGYDELDRLKWTQYEDGTVISYLYDKVGNRTARSVDAGSLASFTITGTATGYGSLVPSGTIMIASGNNQTFIIEPGPPPAPGSLLALLIDNVQINLGSLPMVQGPYGPRYYYTFTGVGAEHTITANFSDATYPPCANYPARLAGAVPGNYLSLFAAYDAAVNGDTIQGNMYDHSEDLFFDRNVSVTLDGGYACDYTSIAGDLTIKGHMSIVSGSVTINANVILAGP